MFIYNKKRIMLNTDTISEFYIEIHLTVVKLMVSIIDGTEIVFGEYETIELAQQKFDDIRNLLGGELIE